MPTVDLVDETYLRVPLETVAAVVHDRTRWADWWPELMPAIFMDRGPAGIRWNVTGRLVGSMEIWLEPYEQPLGGVLLHFYLRADPTAAGSAVIPAPAAGRRASVETARWARSSKRNFWALKDELEAGLRSRREGGSIAASASEHRQERGSIDRAPAREERTERGAQRPPRSDGADRPVRGAHDGGQL